MEPVGKGTEALSEAHSVLSSLSDKIHNQGSSRISIWEGLGMRLAEGLEKSS